MKAEIPTDTKSETISKVKLRKGISQWTKHNKELI